MTTPKLPATLDVLDQAERLRTLNPALLSRTADPVLQLLVEEAARVADFPIALVTLVAQRIQFFRASVGLPPDLATSQATDRCTSFCQYVVAGNAPLVMQDAALQPDLPRDLIDRYSLRAYAGFPLQVAGHPVGSLCVLHVEPRRLSAKAQEQLRALAVRASARLEALARQDGGAAVVSTSPPQDAGAHAAWLRLAEMQPLASLEEALAQGRLSPEEFQRALGALATLSTEG